MRQAIKFETFTHFTSFRRSTFIIVVLSIEISLEISCKKQDKRSIETIIKPSRIVPRYESSKKMLFVMAGFSLQTKYQFSDNRGIVRGSSWNPPFELQRRKRIWFCFFYTSKIRIRCYSSYMRSNCSRFTCALYSFARAF